MSRTRIEDTLFNDKEAFPVYDMVTSQQIRPSIPRRWKARVRSLLQNMLVSLISRHYTNYYRWSEDVQKRYSIEQTVAGLNRILPTDFPPSRLM